MKVINRISVTFLLLDSLNKNPLMNSVIKCNGKFGGYVVKNGGYFIYTNLEKGNYKFEISCKGFNTQYFDLDIQDDSNEFIVCTMNYTSDNSNVFSMKRFLLKPKSEGLPLKNKSLKVIQNTKVPYLRVIKPTDVDSNELSINNSFDKRLIYQEYVYGTGSSNTVYLQNYDYDKECYITKEPFKAKIKMGTFLRPMWNISTDDNGLLVLPIGEIFGVNDILEFTFEFEGKSKKLKLDLKESKSIIEFDF